MAKKKNTVLAKSERLYLSPLQLDDAPTILKWYNDPKVYAHLRDMSHKSSLEETRQWLHQLIQDPAMMVFTVHHLSKDEMIGYGGFKNINHEDKIGEIWRILGETGYWGQGLGTELYWLICNYGFEKLGFQNIIAEHYENNPASSHTAQKSGAKIVGIRRKAKLIDGKRLDVIYTDILPHELIKPKK